MHLASKQDYFHTQFVVSSALCYGVGLVDLVMIVIPAGPARCAGGAAARMPLPSRLSSSSDGVCSLTGPLNVLTLLGW